MIMNISKQVDECKIDMHSGIMEGRLTFIIAITNTGDDEFHDQSAMSSWYNFRLTDEDNIHRVDSMVEFAAVTPHKIKSGETLYQIIKPYTLEEAEKEAKEWNESTRDYALTAITDIEKHKSANKEDKLDFIPHVCMDRDSEMNFEAEFTIKLKSISKQLQMNLTLSELSELSKINDLYENPKK